jgi:hypothetical protein
MSNHSQVRRRFHAIGSTSRPRTELACMYVFIPGVCIYSLSVKSFLYYIHLSQPNFKLSRPRLAATSMDDLGIMQFSIIAHESPVTSHT